jgi:CheY-like chemotaxis protein
VAKRILVVDDVEDWQRTLSGLLTDEGYDATAVGDRETALATIETSRFDLAVIDIRLDETDEGNTAGLNLASEIKGLLPDLPVIIITGYETDETIARAMKPDETGHILAVDFVLKENSNELVDIVMRRLGSPEP